MPFWKSLGKDAGYDDYLKALYNNPDTLIDIEFYNRTRQPKTLWVQPGCDEIILTADSEFKIVTHDKFLRFEYADENRIILYTQYSFGFKLYKRNYSEEIHNSFDWELVYDHSDLN